MYKNEGFIKWETRERWIVLIHDIYTSADKQTLKHSLTHLVI